MSSSISTGPSTKGLQILAIPAVCILISFLGYFSQYIFNASSNLPPGPLTTRETILFNTLLLSLWYTYYRACTVSAGQYVIPSSSSPTASTLLTSLSNTRWCKKCRQPKPPRAHHCRHCGCCIPKMDHHCPWTGNCVSLQTFPYFLRFLIYANLSLWTLLYFIIARLRILWSDRHLPSYLGPSLATLVYITMLGLMCGGTLLALSILLFTTAKGWILNMTMIEGWELERHEAIIQRYERGNYADDDDDVLAIDRVEFPYDVGFFRNMTQAMGTRNVLLWVFPFAGGPAVSPDGKGTGWQWEENGFNSREGMWPPPDPEKVRRARVGWPGSRPLGGLDGPAAGPVYQQDQNLSLEESRAAFLRRQEEDFRLRGQGQRSEPQEGDEDDELYDVEYEGDDSYEQGMDGEPGWTNSEGDRLRDYGVDEDVEEEDLIPGEDSDDDIPIGELLRRRKVLGRRDGDG